MALASFSTIVEFALRAEESGIGFFSLPAVAETAKDILARVRAEAEKNVKALRATLRENVTEIVMEPCETLDETAYRCDLTLPGGEIAGGDVLGKSIELLEKQRDFLQRAAEAVNLAEVRRAFRKMADRKGPLISEIRQLRG